MDISRLLRKRQLNVQEQNALAEHRIYLTANYWQDNELPRALFEYGKKKNLSWNQSIILQLEIDFPGMPRLIGTILTDKGRFVDFELDTDETHTELNSVDLWDDITDLQNFSTHNKGKGVGYGALALSVHSKLCGET
ncbi:hypothetical protein DNK06_23015 [Pseudomonas daroniae]|uniref:Uncharacterized protein n=1 Tax=Phytopseudomonas daroniae TaxID=2487519 RepID=A0A4Q9QGK2_9GAMM|nr:MULTISPECIES: hypothetical protein [Pseudomonas]TBU72000.1 hypothetical protein DNK06_23015 [Pseudomonas daroniae]TBU75864.1 hypothetical protein DNK31_22855 [Pseudomonas sp. FRB 228]TBU87140.1 hypothetical protein DNJ99_22735 [Pseudomonas daroniae]